MKSITRSQGPDQKEIVRKKLELEELEQELAENELDLSTARRDLHLFENRYQRIVGCKYAELDRLKASVLDMATRIYPDSKDFRSQAEAAREQAEQSAHNWEVHQEQGDMELPEPSEELKKLFRDAAKRIHPDLTTDPEERERRHALMARLNQAYELGDLEQVQAILNDWEVINDWDQLTPGKQLSRLLKQIGQVRHRFNQIQAELKQLKLSEMFRLKDFVQNSEKQGEDVFADMVVDVEEKIESLRVRVKNLAMDCSQL
ncbi:MAG: J domain-containing protein [Nitrospinaceae bacterium]